MRYTLLPLLLTLAACGGNQPPSSPTQALEYPTSNKVDQVDDYHGTSVSDPYRWLEDDVRESDSVAAWVDAQNKVTFDYLEGIDERTLIEQRLTKLWDFEKFGVPKIKGGKYFFSRNDGLQNQSAWYVQDSLDSEPRLVVDPNTWSDDGTVALATLEISPNAQFAALSIQDGGSDWRTIRFLNIDTGEQLADEVKWMKFSSIVWAKDSKPGSNQTLARRANSQHHK